MEHGHLPINKELHPYTLYPTTLHPAIIPPDYFVTHWSYDRNFNLAGSFSVIRATAQ